MEFAPRLKRFDKEIFAELNALKLELEKDGRKIYNMSIGTPDFEPPLHVKEALAQAAMDSANWKYALRDTDELLDAVCDYYKRRYSTVIAPDMVMSCYGTQEGVGHLALALAGEGDTVLLPDPCYPVFKAGVLMSGADIAWYPLKRENMFLPDLDGIPAETAKKAKFIIVSLPSNPVGSVADSDTYDRLIEWANRYDVLIVHDNAYSDIIFTEEPGGSFLSYKGAMDAGVEFFSLSKTFNMTGARVSFLIGRRDVIDAVKLLRSQIDFGMFLPIQKAAAAALRNADESIKEQCAKYRERRDTLCREARRLGWDIPQNMGSMFVWAPLPSGFEKSMGFAMELMKRSGVLVTPGASFGPGGEGFVRFALVMKPEEIAEAFESIKKSGILSKEA